MNVLMFVYGTLKKGFLNHHFLDNAKFIDYSITWEKYQMHPCIENGYPFVIKSENIF